MQTDSTERVSLRTGFRDHRFFLALLIVNVVLARIAMKVYGESFVFFQHAISDLGATVTRNGLPNRRSPWVFLVQMLISCLMCLRYARSLAKRGTMARDHRVWLIRMCAGGFLLMPAPHDLPVTHYIHMFGGGFIFFSLWMLAMIYLSEARRRGYRVVFWVAMTLLQATVLSYAFLFAIDSVHKQAAQGFGLAGMLGTVILATQVVAHTEKALVRIESSTAETATFT